jgi:hypothetical protein
MAMPQKEGNRSYVEQATRKFREDLATLIADSERRGIEVCEVLGDPSELATRAIHATAPLRSPWDDLVGPFTSSEGVWARLGVTRQAVAAKAARRRLLRVITVDGMHLYPLWQFRANRLLPGLADVLALFPEKAVDGWTLSAWLRMPDPDLEESPVNALYGGDEASVLALARTASRLLAV